jgi:hypothetical protein
MAQALEQLARMDNHVLIGLQEWYKNNDFSHRSNKGQRLLWIIWLPTRGRIPMRIS